MLNNVNYNYTNTNVSSRLCLNIYSQRKPWQQAKKLLSNLTGAGIRKENATYKSKGMKRIGNLFNQICSKENLELADKKARKGKLTEGKKNKSRRTLIEIKEHDKNREANILSLQQSLINKTYRTKDYSNFEIFEKKKRLVSRLPYYPYRIVQHAIMNIIEAIFRALFTADTYSCIKDRGLHLAVDNLKTALKDTFATTYYLQLDIHKFYPNVDHDILKQLLRRKFKDANLLWLLDEIIDSAPGLPIGNYTSQHFANFYLTYFDHWIKEVKRVKYYFRYADDIVILSNDKRELHKLRFEIQQYLQQHLKLQIKSNYRVAPVHTGINFLGYIFTQNNIRLRPEIKERFIKMTRYNKNLRSIASYNGWFGPCNGKHLWKRYLPEAV